ncbi:DUF6580 family putative transport protein [Hydrotalea sandarakina]|jgi:hypothetical protein|uniref:Uncharacterized protein n=1 Tax=Hydrotalea sandarakina TaxID=1004304 RepID=A0A2W7RUI2_9BACT|nr:DUF6580 family putative transport protein [Hydrotalea sandarakina]PZX62230.1 hypothetical protein LX80_01711 [Hydrotalea sandarakina]
MTLQKFNPATAVILCIVLLAAALRIGNAGSTLSPLANFSPIGAMGLFGGTYFNRYWKKFVFPLGALFLSDVILMHTIYSGYGNGLLYSHWYYNYLAFAAIVCIGMAIQKVKIATVLWAAIAAAFAHWIITDIPVWWYGGLDIRNGQPLKRNLDGFIQCYVQALPFLKNMLIANILYGAVFYGSYEWLQKKYPRLNSTSIHHS